MPKERDRINEGLTSQAVAAARHLPSFGRSRRPLGVTSVRAHAWSRERAPSRSLSVIARRRPLREASLGCRREACADGTARSSARWSLAALL